jgi:hypothetical protein
MKIVTRYVAEDYEEFSTEHECLEYESKKRKFLIVVEKFFADECNLYEVLECVDQVKFLDAETSDVLKSINKDTIITIRHWQCSDKPKYSVSNLSMDKYGYVTINFGGTSHIGSGYYSSKVGLSDLVRYYNHTFGIKE